MSTTCNVVLLFALRAAPLVAAGLAACLTGCGPDNAPGANHPASQFVLSATQWPEADALFHRDPRWLGADAAFSVPLGSNRTLWLFGDTFLATSEARIRTQSHMVHNTIAVQTGADPTTASMHFAWRGTVAAPEPFFSDDGDHWYWPLHGATRARSLILFLSRVRKSSASGLGFENDGWRAVRIDNSDEGPAAWRVTPLRTPVVPSGVELGTSVVLQKDHVLILGVATSNDHAGYLARVVASDFFEGRFDRIEWWNGEHYAQGGKPAVVMDHAGPECSLHFDARLNRYVHVRSEGFGRSAIAVRFANAPEGPWSKPVSVFRPPENDIDQVLVYAAKGHPELAGTQLAVTYASNTFAGLGTLVRDDRLYYPRFVKLRWDR